MRKSLKRVWIWHRKTWRHFKKRFWKLPKSSKGLSIHKILMAIGFSLFLISIVGFFSTRTAEVVKVSNTTETTTTQETTTTEETTTIETTTTSTTVITTTTTISRRLEELKNDLKELGYHVTYVEREIGKCPFGNFENYVLVAIKKFGLIPEKGPINFNLGRDISENVDFYAQAYYPDSEVSITLIFYKSGCRFIRCVKSSEFDDPQCSEVKNFPEKYC